MSETIAFVWVTHEFVGFHRWPTPTPHRAYLGDLHRHVFKVRLWLSVDHDDREVEFHDLQSQLEQHCSRWVGIPDIGMSCEMVARHILDFFEKQYPGRTYTVEVSEDGENGATLHRFPPA